MTSGRLSLAVALAAGCRERLSLPDVPIEGGTPEQQQAARDELLAFDGWVGAGRVQLTEVRIQPMSGHIVGRFRDGTDRILIDEERSLGDLRRTLRHELCHAVDYGERLFDAPFPPLDAYAERMWTTWSYQQYGANRRLRRGEAFATACEFGPWGAHARATPCPGEDPVAVEIASFLLDHVWTGFAPNPPVPRDPSELVVTACHPDGLDIVDFHVSPTSVRDHIDVHSSVAEIPDITNTFRVHLYTGQRQAWAVDDLPLERNEVPVVPGAILVKGAVLDSGVGAAHAIYDLPDLGEATYRLYRTDGVDWFPADPLCRSVEHDDTLFAADDRLWFAWLDGSCVRWRDLP